MATSRQQVKEWYDEGKKEGHKFMTVIFDTFGWSDFPIYGNSPKLAGEMEKIMEVFDLSKPFPPNLSGVIYKSMETWEKEYNKMVELNEFFGLPYDEHTDNLIKNFIHQALIDYKEETLNLITEEISQAQIEGDKTSRLISLYNKIK